MRFLLAFHITLVIKNKKINLMYIYHLLIHNLHVDTCTYNNYKYPQILHWQMTGSIFFDV